MIKQEIILGITIEEILYLGIFLVSGLTIAFIIKIAAVGLKRNLRKNDDNRFLASIIDAIDGAIVLWVLLFSFYLGINSLITNEYHVTLLQQGLIVISVIIASYALVKVQRDSISWFINRSGWGVDEIKVLNSLAPMAKRVIATTIIAMSVLIILDQLGIAIAPLVAGLGVGGLAVALALQSTFTNFFAGLNVLTDGSIRTGDFIELDSGSVGEVEQIGWRTTKIRTMDNNMVIIPNYRLAESVTVNYSFPKDEMSLYVQVGVAYSSDLQEVERVTVEVAKKVLLETPGAIAHWVPSIWYTNFGDSNIDFWVVLRARGYLESWLVKHNFVKELLDRYNSEGIEISFPARNIFMRSPDTSDNAEEDLHSL